MFDGINATYKLTEKDNHILNFPLWEILINEQSGERVNDFKTFSLNGIFFLLRPSLIGGYILSIKGSLHKWHNQGKHNANQFYFNDVKEAIFNLCTLLNIPADKINVHGLEIGINLTVPFPILRLFKAMVSYKGKPFTQINKASEEKGFVCSLNEYELKIYDKGKQSRTGEKNLLRFEVKVKKMRYLKNTFKNFSDLMVKDKAYTGITYLENAFNSIIWTDTTVNKNLMDNREVKQWLYYSNPKTWQEIKGKEKLLYHRNKWKILLNKYGKTPDILPIIFSTWKNLFFEEKEAHKTSPFHQLIFFNEALKNLTFSPFICNGEKVIKTDLKRIEEKPTFCNTEINNTNIAKATKHLPNFHQIEQEKRTCKTCGKDISNQRRQSVYCSSKYVGPKQAKQCRNKISNRKRIFKMKIQKARIENKFLSITYTNENLSYTDILHPKEFEFNEWLIKILKIELL
ncbi:MAG: hypothetical protein ABIP68_01670 [Ferruginibacter sp.]